MAHGAVDNRAENTTTVVKYLWQTHHHQLPSALVATCKQPPTCTQQNRLQNTSELKKIWDKYRRMGWSWCSNPNPNPKGLGTCSAMVAAQ
mmetsp:Transcript_101925/g.172700  ORF Transcript_101925/g.172700 Transcript_101925/m.172700 type:complete len:90 (-) Transcript_101925:1042-1311(-)